jgi:biopolymer transport protein ExbD
MRIERQKKRTAEVYTASLNDIMFFLLLFFLIISTMATSSAIRVLLPQASSAQNIVSKRNIQLVITKDLRYYIDNKEISFDQLKPSLTEIVATKTAEQEIAIALQADKELNLQQVVDVINIGNELGVKMVLFAKKNH